MYVYMMTNRPNGTLYTSSARDLKQRVLQHRLHMLPGFADRYNLVRLVWFEQHDTAPSAVQRERNIKHWVRAWKINLIQERNPTWRDLWDEIPQV